MYIVYGWSPMYLHSILHIHAVLETKRYVVVETERHVVWKLKNMLNMY